MVADEGLLDQFRDIFSFLVDRKNLTFILVSIISYFIWLMAFPLFGPIITNYLSSLEALTIEKGRILRMFLLSMTVSSLITGYLIDKYSRKIIFIYASAFGSSILTFLPCLGFPQLPGFSYLFSCLLRME